MERLFDERRRRARGDIDAARTEHEAATRALEILKTYSHEPEPAEERAPDFLDLRTSSGQYVRFTIRE